MISGLSDAVFVVSPARRWITVADMESTQQSHDRYSDWGGIDGLVDQLFAAVMLTGREPMSSRASNAPPMWSTHLAFGLL